ncbi:hypothetical protein WR25_19823 [Diploscapter pachys]|uniref:Major sperm protein n=1 Tax=Diploscapter pachys TaxID=2018661 RepID=A0A2A2LAZ6_9BILA|nr:hypothetical protein WR25_19823 [Diploscapter pachys]
MALANVILNPSKSVTYMPMGMKQLAEVSIENNEATPIVYGLVRPNEKKTIRLIFKGLGDKKCPTKDRHTCVLVTTTSSNVCPEFVWKNHRCRAQMAESSIVKRTLKILFVGVNDAADKEKKMDIEQPAMVIDKSQNVAGNILIQTGGGFQDIKQQPCRPSGVVKAKYFEIKRKHIFNIHDVIDNEHIFNIYDVIDNEHNNSNNYIDLW